MAAAQPSAVATRVRQALDAGRTREEIVRDLVESGYSQRSAEFFVDKATQAPSPAAPASSDDADGDESGGIGALIAGAFWLSLGSTVTGATFLLAPPGGKFTVAYGAVIAGLLAFGRGLKRWSASGQAFPLAGVLVAAAAPPVLIVGTAGVVTWHKGRRVAARQAAEERRLEEARAVLEEERAVRGRKAADEEREQRHTERIGRLVRGLNETQSAVHVCETALKLGAMRAREAIPELKALLLRPTESASVRNCAADALVQLGETVEAQAFYEECARAGGGERLAMALSGFADIGPSTAGVALPYFREALQYPYPSMRLLAVEKLPRLGPAAHDLLRQAQADADPTVRDLARKKLASMPRF